MSDKLDNVINELNDLPLQDYLRAVQVTADRRFKASKQRTSKASYFHDIANLATRYLKILRS